MSGPIVPGPDELCRAVEAAPVQVLQGVRLVLDRRAAGGWCARPYPGHPRGCPMIGTRPQCPPLAPHVRRVLDLGAGAIDMLVVATFDLERHEREALLRHPDWSRGQLRNPRHWQGKVRASLHLAIRRILLERPDLVALDVPEACGVDVTETCRLAGVPLEWPVRRLARKVAILGRPLEGGEPAPPLLGERRAADDPCQLDLEGGGR